MYPSLLRISIITECFFHDAQWNALKYFEDNTATALKLFSYNTPPKVDADGEMRVV